MEITRRDWWLGILLIVGGLVAHALLPRYEWVTLTPEGDVIKVDKWTGVEEHRFVTRPPGAPSVLRSPAR